jgi:prepilin-type N-terminal cleavage/methylation domain-containing protein
MKRLGFTLLELIASMLVLSVLTTVCLKFFAAGASQQKEQYACLAATEEAANVMEYLAATGWDDLPQQSGEKLTLSPQAKKLLPQGRIEVNVSGTLRVPPSNGTPPASGYPVPDTLARRVVTTVFWRPMPNEPERKARVVAWRYKQP